MRINKVTASAFGPLVDQELSLASGMTVIVGDNESAKSSWHAALYSALCGRRRGKGAPIKDDRRFSDLPRPWDADRWVVSANITLDDGRTVEMHQDLDGKVDCRARDMGMGASDISNEIMFEGSPDASRWLGLDRRSFAATATVNQAELLKILADERAGSQSEDVNAGGGAHRVRCAPQGDDVEDHGGVGDGQRLGQPDLGAHGPPAARAADHARHPGPPPRLQRPPRALAHDGLPSAPTRGAAARRCAPPRLVRGIVTAGRFDECATFAPVGAELGCGGRAPQSSSNRAR